MVHAFRQRLKAPQLQAITVFFLPFIHDPSLSYFAQAMALRLLSNLLEWIQKANHRSVLTDLLSNLADKFASMKSAVHKLVDESELNNGQNNKSTVRKDRISITGTQMSNLFQLTNL